ncbi:hypothetical protein EDD21DRAFT_382616 [Dissophora ornata]|nr:hypothetical protein EDD21DRAFT_382616 [Dissophora ornata]
MAIGVWYLGVLVVVASVSCPVIQFDLFRLLVSLRLSVRLFLPICFLFLARCLCCLSALVFLPDHFPLIPFVCLLVCFVYSSSPPT